MKKFGKRLGALMIGAAMLTTTVAASGLMSVATITADAASEKTVTIGQELAIPVKNSSGDVTNQDKTSIRKDVSTLAESGITSLQFNLSAEAEVAEFVFYLGISLADDPWWANIEADKTMAPEGTSASKNHSYKCTPYSTEFSVVVDVSNLDIGYEGEDKAYQFENCYTGDTDGNEIAITLESITVNGKTDTSVGEPKGNLNTGGAGYTTANNKSGTSQFIDNGDGTATLKSTITKKIDDVSALYKDVYGTDVILTPSPEGEDYSEDGYYYESATGKVVKAADVTWDPTKYARATEEQIRKAGYLLNGHKFAYKDFGIYPSASETSEIQIESLKVVLRAPSGDDVKRIQYGGGLNVVEHSPADTEWTKNQAGLKDDKNSGYWYNDMGTKALEDTQAAIDAYNAANNADIAFGVDVENGQDIRDAHFGDYVEVTWDVPAEVVPYTTTKDADTISFQLWYGDLNTESGDYAPLKYVTMESAALTYTQSITFPYQAQAKKTVSEKLDSSAGSEFLFSDFGMEYEFTADVYGIEFKMTAPQGIDNLVLGAGTSVRKTCRGATADYWFQQNDCPNEKPENNIVLINSDESKKEYTFLWIMPGAVATGFMKDANTGKYGGNATNYISTEQEGDNFKLAAYYAGWKDEASDIPVTINDITLYYTTDDRENTAKSDMFEKALYVNPDSYEMEVGDEVLLKPSVDDCTFKSGDESVATVDNKGNVTAVGAGETTITVTTPHGQVVDVTIVVTEPFVPLYGDTNLDGAVSLIDVVYLNKCNAGIMTFNEQQMENANCVYDDAVNSSDATILLQYLVELVDKVGPGAVEL